MTTLTRRVVRRGRRNGIVVHTRVKWGSRYKQVYTKRVKTHPHTLLPKRPTDTVVAHISVTNRTGYTKAKFFADVRTVERIGMERFKSGISYNILWCPRRGHIALGQPFASKGTHTVNVKKLPGFSYDQNAMAIAICMVGPVGIKPTKRALRRLAKFLAILEREKVITGTYDFVPHSSFAAKDCPTDSFRNKLPELRRTAKDILPTLK